MSSLEKEDAGEQVVKEVDELATFESPSGEVETSNLHRAMSDRHMSFIAIGSCIGTGLFLGSGSALAHGGPLGLFMGYGLMGTVVYGTMMALGEMVAYLPIQGGHLGLAHRFVDPAWSFAMSWNYTYLWLIILAAEVSAGAVLINYWITSVNNVAWITMILAVVIAINIFGSRGFAEAETVFASIKVLTIIGLIIVGIAIDLGAGSDNHGYLGFKYWREPGPFVQYKGISGSLGRFLGFWAVMTQAAFSFLGTEVVAITAAESKNPRRAVPNAIRKVWIRIVIFYVLGVFVIGLITPSDNARLGTASNASASPFVIGIDLVGIKVLPSLINACILTSAWSAATADLYLSSRSLHTLAVNGDFFKVFAKTTKSGLPWASVALCACFGALAYMSVSVGANKVFGYFADMTSTNGLSVWFGINVTYLRFRKGMEVQGIDRATLPFSSRFAKFGAYWSLFWIVVVCFFSAWQVFLVGEWDTGSFLTSYIPIVLFPCLYLGKKFYSKTATRKYEEMDFVTGTQLFQEIDEAEKAPSGGWLQTVKNVFV